MAEHEQELLIRDFTVPEVHTNGNGHTPVEKPWSAERKAKLVEEDKNLRLTESFLEHQLLEIKARRTAIRLEILDGYTRQDQAPVADPYIEKMRSPYVPPVEPRDAVVDAPKFNPKGLFRGFRRKLGREIPLPVAAPGEETIHFAKPYTV